MAATMPTARAIIWMRLNVEFKEPVSFIAAFLYGVGMGVG
jgi:hypothetical protein